MRVLSLKTRASGQIPTSSMADIAFLLLIFFLVTTVFDEERGLSLLLPTQDVVDVSPKNVLHLLVRPDGLVDVRQGASMNVRTVRPEEVETIWRMASSENANLIAGVKADPGATYRRMIAVLDALQLAGATRISLQAMDTR